MQGDEVRSAVAAADRDSFASWVRPHWPAMVRLAGRLTGPGFAEDVVQDALASAWRSRGRFDPQRGSARAWLFKIVVNTAHDHHRTTHLAGQVPDLPIPGGLAGISETVDLSTLQARLSERQRLAVALFYYLQLSVEECAETMGCSSGTVKSTLSDARKRLRAMLGEEYR